MTEEVADKPAMKLRPTNELVFAMMTKNLDDEYRDLLIGDPHEFIFSWYNVDLNGDVHVVQNTEKEVHLVLPFYQPRFLAGGKNKANK